MWLVSLELEKRSQLTFVIDWGSVELDFGLNSSHLALGSVFELLGHPYSWIFLLCWCGNCFFFFAALFFEITGLNGFFLIV